MKKIETYLPKLNSKPTSIRISYSNYLKLEALREYYQNGKPSIKPSAVFKHAINKKFDEVSKKDPTLEAIRMVIEIIHKEQGLDKRIAHSDVIVGEEVNIVERVNKAIANLNN